MLGICIEELGIFLSSYRGKSWEFFQVLIKAYRGAENFYESIKVTRSGERDLLVMGLKALPYGDF